MPSSNTPLERTDDPLVVILGPTAVGKTEISIRLAERWQGEIVSADSRLLYRGMDIGTAKPTPAEQARVPHHLIDVSPPDQVWSLAQYQQRAYEVIADIHARGKLPFLVGGTGQYIQAVIAGWEIPAVAPAPHLRQALQSWADQIGAEQLHQRLAFLDPEAAHKIQAQNVRRTVRAWEVILSTGRLFSEQRQQAGSPYRVLQFGLIRPRAELYARVDARIDAMLAAGFLEEVEQLLAAGYQPDLPPLSAIGYRQVIAHLQGEISLQEIIIQMKRLTRQFVRRQANWFKLADPHIHWVEVTDNTLDEMHAVLKAFMTQKAGKV